MDVRSYSEYTLFRLALAGLKILPYGWSRGILRRTAAAAGRTFGLRRKVAESQLGAVFPELSSAELADLVCRMYDHLGITAAEVLCAQPDALAELVTVKPGWDVLERALEQGRGAIVATGHIGNFELGGRVLAQRFPLLDVVKTQRNAPFDRFIQEQRQRFGIRTVPVDKSGPAVLRHLQTGGLVTLLMDQDAGKTGIVTDFLGREASTWTGAARISIRTGCPVVPVAILRNDDQTHTLHLGAALEPVGLTDRDQDIREFTSRISAAVEGFIRKRPEQWFWVHRRWKGAGEARRVNGSIAGN